MDNQVDDKANKPWVVRDVPEHTRRKVKAYAAMQGITMGQAIERLVEGTQDEVGEDMWVVHDPAGVRALVIAFAEQHNTTVSDALQRLVISGSVAINQEQLRLTIHERQMRDEARPPARPAARRPATQAAGETEKKGEFDSTLLK